MLLAPIPLSHTVTPTRTPSPSSVTYFMDGPYNKLSRGKREGKKDGEGQMPAVFRLCCWLFLGMLLKLYDIFQIFIYYF